jgi:hypothetical protein
MSFIIQPGSTAKSDVYSSSGTWAKPSGITFVQVQLWGGGAGGGAGGIGTSANGGGGGGGGGCNMLTFPASALPSTVTVTIGAGGAGGAAQTSGSGAIGSAGGNTTFGSFLKAIGGSGGTIATNNAGGAGGGNGFSTTNGYGTAGGSQSGTQANGNSAEYGGGSGGAGNVSGAGFGAAGGSSMFGGCGGAGGNPINSSVGGRSYLGGISTDTLTALNTTGATSGSELSVNGAAGVAQRADLPVGGGGGAGASGAISNYPFQARNYLANGRIFEVTTNGFLYSTDDGVSYSILNFNPNSVVGIGYINSTYYIGMSTGEIFSSTDLITWTSLGLISTAAGLNLTGLCSNGTTLNAMGGVTGEDYIKIWKSTNGTTWTSVNTGTTSSTYANYTIRFNNGYFWGFRPNNINATWVYLYSADGTTWTAIDTVALGVFSRPRAIAYGSANVVIINANASTPNGVAYGAVNSPTNQTLTGTLFNDIAYGGGVFVVVANGGVIYTSSDDGVNWTARTSGTASNFQNVFWTGTRFIAITSNNALEAYTSTNGTTWTLQKSIISSTQFNAGTGGAGGVASGGGGGGAAFSGFNSGAGGAGGNGYARILSW